MFGVSCCTTCDALRHGVLLSADIAHPARGFGWAGRPNGTRTRWPRGSKRRGRGWKDGEGTERVAVLRGRVGQVLRPPKARTWSLRGHTPVATVRAAGTSQRCSACGFTTRGSRESQAMFVCKNEGCGWSGNADHNAARNILHLYRMGHGLIPAAGRAVVRRPRGVKPATAR